MMGEKILCYESTVRLADLLSNLKRALEQLCQHESFPFTMFWDLKDVEYVSMDPSLFQRLLSNLVTNATIHNDSGTPISVYVQASRSATCTDKDQLQLTGFVSDKGKGIPLSIFPNLFKSSPRTHSKDSGYGLIICREIVSSMGGTIQADSPQDGQGATFRFSMNVKKTASPKTPSPPPERTFTKPLKILIADDNNVIRLSLARVITKIYPLAQVEFASDGHEAYLKLKDAQARGAFYDLAIFDKQMAGNDPQKWDGDQAARTWRQEEQKHRLRILGFTGNNTQSEIEDFKSSGVDDVLIKGDISLLKTWFNLFIKDNSGQED